MAKGKVFQRQTLAVLAEAPNPEKPGTGYGIYVVRWNVDGTVGAPRVGSAQFYTKNGIKCLAGLKGLTLEDTALVHKKWVSMRAALSSRPEFKADVMPLDSSNEAPMMEAGDHL